MDKPDIMDRIRHIAKPKHQAVLSKSRYTSFCQCPKKLWLKVHNAGGRETFGTIPSAVWRKETS